LRNFQGRVGSRMQKKCSIHLAALLVLIALVAAPLTWAAPATVSGLVRDTSGVPQIGAEVQLLRPDLTVVASAYTDSKGRFIIASVLPGQYALKAMNASFLPSLRENLRLRSGATVVNVTLNTLYEVMQWLPAEPRAKGAEQDDWAWTLRSAANRPLLRWLEDGPLVVVSDGSASAPRLKARIIASGQAGTFGESGERFSATVEDTPSSSRELLARVDFAPDTDAAMESMLGFRQDLGFAGSVQSVAAVAVHPEIESGGGEGLDEAALSSMETMHLGPDIEAEVGSSEVLARLAGPSGRESTGGPSSGGTLTRGLPFATAEWRDGDNAIHYRMATMIESPQAGNSELRLPQFSARNGELAMEHGLHQEIGWDRQTDNSGFAFLVYRDTVDNPVIEAGGRLTGADTASTGALFDPASGLLRFAGSNFSTTGIEASVERRLPGSNQLRVSYAGGNALAMPAAPQVAALPQLIAAFHPRRVQSYSISLSGTLDGTGTKWQASYRWQPDDTVTAVAPYAMNMIAPYLNIRLGQSLHQSRDGSSNVEALLEVTNLLAEGYHPYILNDGSVLFFAQGERSLRGGLAFTF
jgi:hypothetical protein